jgi:hypothetical protein
MRSLIGITMAGTIDQGTFDGRQPKKIPMTEEDMGLDSSGDLD